MDKLAAELGMDPVELRKRNALRTGVTSSPGRPSRAGAGGRAAESSQEVPAAPSHDAGHLDLSRCPAESPTPLTAKGCVAVWATRGSRNRLLEGFNDYSTARVRLSIVAANRASRSHGGGRGGAGTHLVQAQIAGTSSA